MDLEEAMYAGHDVTRGEAIAEAKRHGMEAVDLDNELGEHKTYSARSILEWLGY